MHGWMLGSILSARPSALDASSTLHPAVTVRTESLGIAHSLLGRQNGPQWRITGIEIAFASLGPKDVRFLPPLSS